MPAAKNIAGQKFGYWEAICKDPKKSGRWMFRCICGTVRSVDKTSVMTGKSKSCGCQKKRLLIDSKTQHGKGGGRNGQKRHPAYGTWAMMKTRCNNPKSERYKNYGGRGIKVCPEWNTFQGFWADMGDTWEPGLSIHRIDNDGDYHRENCVWADSYTQASHKQNSLYVIYHGQRFFLKDLCQAKGVNYRSVHNRIYDKGWTVEDAIDKPFGRWANRVK